MHNHDYNKDGFLIGKTMILTRIDLENIEQQTLAPYATINKLSQGRIYQETQDPYRLDFQRDRDRIIHSHAFRRLKDKTQVFVAHYGDHYRNRLTHSLEVAQLSRDIARNLGVNEDLCETIALAHDLGHTPFGHAGELTFANILKKFNDTFEHNEQSKRIVTILEKKNPNYLGLNLTKEVLDGLAKHQTIYDQQGLIVQGSLSIEAQIVNICDEIAYHNHDIDDSIRAGILKIEDLMQIELFKQAYQNISATTPNHLITRMSVSALIKIMVNDLYQETEKHILQENIKSLKDVHQSKTMLVSFSKEMKEKIMPLQKLLNNNFYHHPKVRKQSERGQKIIEFLFDLYLSHPPLELTKMSHDKNEPLHITIKDYIAGMTDAFAEKQFQDNP